MHVPVTCCILTFQIVTFINVKVTFLKYVTVTQCRNTETTTDHLNIFTILDVTYINVTVTVTFLCVNQ